MLRRNEKTLGLPVGDLIPVEMDDHIAFACGRSGACCQGRHPLSNVVMPQEASYMWRAFNEDGITDIEQFVPETLSRFITVTDTAPSGARRDQLCEAAPRSAGRAPIGHFGGLMFRMTPDATMPDGDRCQFLTGDTPGQYGCRWHRTRGQPTACALAPVGIFGSVGDQAPVLAVPKSRYAWCQGVREMTDIGAAGFTVRELFDRADGDSRLAEANAFGVALEATKSWSRGYRNHHSPLAKLYIEALPELEPVLVAY